MDVLTQSTFRVAQLNAENLFIYLDHYQNQDLKSLSEQQWQELSSSMVDNKPLHKTRWLAESLREMDPDVVILSEVGGIESLENFNTRFLGGEYNVHLVEGNSDRGIDVGYLVHRRLPLQALLISHKSRALNFNYPHERLWNEQYQGDPEKKKYASHRFSRDIAELRLFDAQTQQIKMIFLACHLKSKLDREGIDPMGKDRRRAEFETLLKIYQEIRTETHNQVPIVIGGDFNGQARASDPDEEFKSIKGSDLRDIFDLMGVEEKDRLTRFNIRNGQPPVGQQIDYIFLSPELQSKIIPDHTYVYRYKSELGVTLPDIQTATQQFAMPSDHYPVLVTLQWTPK